MRLLTNDVKQKDHNMAHRNVQIINKKNYFHRAYTIKRKLIAKFISVRL